MVLLMMALHMDFSRFPAAQSDAETPLGNLILLSHPACRGMNVTFECNFPVVGNPLENVVCIPGIQAPGGF
jgi:hypothetical protein